MSNILSQRWLLSRRHFLRGLGATMALPLLDAMIPLRARAAAEAAKPRRSVFVYIPNGVNGMTWQCTKAGRDYELSPSLKPLAKHREDFTVFSGLHHPNGLGQAHVCADTWLTGAKIDAQGGRKYENTVSCDQTPPTHNTCSLNSAPVTIGATTYEAGRVLTVSIQAGSGLASYPLTITGTTALTDAAGNNVNLGGGSDITIQVAANP